MSFLNLFQCVSMLSVERLHLEHVLQTVCALEAVILRSFGPEGGQVLFTRSTGQAMLSRSGTQILKALHLEHPLARLPQKINTLTVLLLLPSANSTVMCFVLFMLGWWWSVFASTAL